MKRKWFYLVLPALLAILALFFFWLLPHGVDAIRNGVVRTDPVGAVPALHERIQIVDLHADTLLWDRSLHRRGSRGHVDGPRLREGRVGLQVFSVVTKSPRGLNVDRNPSDSDNITLLAAAQRWPLKAWTSLLERALFQARKLDRTVQESGGRFAWIRRQGELRDWLERREKGEDVIGVILALEGSHSLEGKIGNLDSLEEAGFRMLAPTHLFDNDLAGSQAGEEKGGLTPLGEEWVRRMNQKHLMIDLAHASSAAIDDVLRLSTRPVLVSHTGVKAVCPSNRNLTDDQIRAIAKSGGVIGVGFWADALCEVSFRSVARTLRHLIQVGGPGVAALGSDWDGFVTTVRDAAGLGELTGVLLKEGFTDDEIRGVMGGNALGFFARELPE